MEHTFFWRYAKCFVLGRALGFPGVVLLLLLTFLVASASKGHLERCPPYELLYPCYCNSMPKYDERINCTRMDTFAYHCQAPVITCIGHGLDNLPKLFAKVSEHIGNAHYRKFEWLFLIDHGISSLPSGLFSKLYFRNIYIKSCPNLKVINETAFGLSNGHYTENVFINASHLSDEPHLRRATFKALSSLRNLDVLEFQSSNFSTVPYKAFNRQSKLRIIRFYNPDQKQQLQTIGSRAFFKANKLEEIDLKGNRIFQIKPFAFQFQHRAEHEVKIFLSGNMLNSESFEVNSLLGANGRNVTLYLGDYDNCNLQLSTLKKEVFEPFLEENQGNVVDMYGCPLFCDYQMEWLTFRLERYRQQVRNLECVVQSRFASKDSYNYYHVTK